jgi:ArsR family metal-binding transcriptional regulator
MFLKEIKVIETSPCLAEKHLFKGITMASVSLTEILPYLNAIVDKPNYQPNSNSLTFKDGIIGFTLQDYNINITRFANMTHLYEILDWIKNLINDAYESRDEIEPRYKARKIVPVFKIHGLLPKTNCRECGEQSCMAFAAKLNNFDAEIDECPPLQKNEYADLRKKLITEMELDL